MTKKILSLILIFVLATGCLCFTNTASADSDVYGEEALMHIKNLGILPADTDGDEVISRGEFAQAIYNIAGRDIDIPYERLYYDVETTDSYSKAVMWCTKNGYMVGSANMFRPDDAITYIEAMTVIARVLNYTEYAKNHGDYSLGYYTTAKNIGLLKNTGITETSSPLTAKNCATMLYNALRTGMNKLSYINPIYHTYQTSTKIFAYEAFGYNYAKGVMQSNGYADISGKDNLGKHLVVIDNIAYTSKLMDEAFRFYIGQEVSVFYDDDNNIVSLAPTGTSNVISVGKESFGSKKGNYFEYCEDDYTTRKIKISDKAVYLKNGKVVMGYNATGFSGAEFADITFIDSDGDETYDCVLVNIYNTFVVSSAFSDGVYYSVGNAQKVDLSEDVEKTIFVYDQSGELKSADHIKTGYVLSVVEGADFIYVIYSNSVIKGLLNEKDEYSVTVEGMSVEIPNGTAKVFENIKTGDNVSIYLDFAGRGVKATKNVGNINGELYGYLVEGLYKDGIDKTIKLRIYNNEGVLGLYSVDSNFKVNDKKYRLNSLDKIPDVFYDEKGKFNSTVVFYELNADNEIVSVDFPKTTLSPDEDGFIQTAKSQTAYKISNGSLTNRTIRSDNTYFSGKEFLNANSVIFVIPKTIDDEERYAIITEDDISESTDYVWDLFHFSKYNGYVDVAVMHSDYAALSYDTRLSVVVSVSKRLDSDGVERLAVKHCANGVEYMSMADENFEISQYVFNDDGTKTASKIKMNQIKPGDAVRFTTGENGLLRTGERVYEYNAVTNPFKSSSKSGAYATSSLYMDSGYVAYNDKSLLRIASTKEECTSITHDLFNLTGVIYSSAQITVVEETARGVNVYAGTTEDVAIGDCIIFQSRSGLGKYVIVYKDK